MRLLAALLLTLAAAAACAAGHESAAARRGQLKELHGRIETLRRDLVKNEKTHAKAADRLKQTETAISGINRGLLKLGEQRRQIGAQLAALTVQSRRLKTLIDAQQAQLSRLLYRQYVDGDGDSDPLQRFLGGANPNQAARNSYYLSLLSRAKADLLERLRRNFARKRHLTAAARDKHAELAVVEHRVQRQRAALLEHEKERRALVASLAGKIAGQRHEIDVLRRNEKRLADLIESLSRRERLQRLRRLHRRQRAEHRRGLKNEHTPQPIRFSGDFAKLRGRLRLPIRGRIVNRFGERRPGGGPVWRGLFIHAPAGTPVKAIAPGRVAYAGRLRGFGKLIIITHGDGYLSVYGDNRSLLRRVGDTVKAGEAVATVGRNGSGESGLYFELRHRGLAIDPLHWVNLK